MKDSSPLNVLLTDPLHPDARQDLASFTRLVVAERPSRVELLALMQDTEVLVCRSSVTIDAEVLEASPRLFAIIRAGNGLDNIDLRAATDLGISVDRLPGPGVNAVAEFVVGALLSLSRRITEADRQVKAGIWRKADLVGTELRGKTLGLIGCGRIGTRVAELAQAFDMRILAAVATPSVERRISMAKVGIELVSLPQLMGSADCISVQVPGGPPTRGLVSASLLRAVRPGCLLVDVSRAQVVDHAAVLHALNTGHLAGAAADVHSDESGVPVLAEHDRAVSTPHIAGSTWEAQREIGADVVSRIRSLSDRESWSQ